MNPKSALSVRRLFFDFRLLRLNGNGRWEALVKALGMACGQKARLYSRRARVCDLCNRPMPDGTDGHGYGECVEIPEELARKWWPETAAKR